MYLLASAFFVASIYTFWLGDNRTATLLVEVALIVAGARFLLGPQEEASVLRKITVGVGILILIAVITYTTHTLLG